jgi:UDP-GlcNAc:undecaprenyl-phosphate GlcNAc-1-phosphate transferase
VTFPFALITALVISMAIIPLMMRLAPRLGMVDLPDPRKVHARPIPRVGGIGIALGSIAAMLLWMPMQGWMPSYLAGSVVLLLFGAWDDSRELGHYVKFVGQFAAAVAVVYWGGLWVSQFPFFGDAVPAAIGKPFTVIAIVGMVNAVNHSDGLDGLAGGEALLSLGCLAYLGYLAGGTDLVLISAAVIGGVFGFLRYNTHPARVFMGDSGSQFLGFSLAVFAVLLTQQVNPGLSMAIPVLILGLPIVDILAVLVQRVYQRMNWFRATKNHVHHRLLELGYRHYEAVVIIYAVQAALVICAILFRYESDALVLGLYLAACTFVFVALMLAERSGWKVRHAAAGNALRRIFDRSDLRRIALLWSTRFIRFGIPAYFLVASLGLREISADCGWAAVLVAVLTLAGLLLSRSAPFAPGLMRMGVFSAAALLVYLVERNTEAAEGLFTAVQVGFFSLLALAVGVSIRFSGEEEFRTTPTDYLLVGVVVISSVLAQGRFTDFDLGTVIVQLVVLLYGCELLINRAGSASGGPLSLAAFLAAVGVTLRFAV